MFGPDLSINKDALGLYAEADRIRRKFCGDEVHLRGIIEFSNICSRNCFYCGLRKSNTSLPRYKMGKEEILNAASEADRKGVRTIVLQSGENDDENLDFIASLVQVIKTNFDLAVTLCIGVKSRDFYQSCKQAGADRYLLKHEIAAPELYRRYHPDSHLYERLDALKELKKLGYQTGTGNITGLPGQSMENILADIYFAEILGVDMAASGPFIPAPRTPLQAYAPGNLNLALNVIALTRIMLKNVHIPATAAFDAISGNGREFALRSGANVIMANITPPEYRALYGLYPREHLNNSVENAKELIDHLQRPLAKTKGHSLKHKGVKTTC